MKEYDERTPHAPPPPPPEERHKKKKRHHRRGFLIILLLLLIIAILILMLVYGGFGGVFGGNGGFGEGGNSGPETSAVVGSTQETSSLETDTDTGEEQGTAILIEINGEKINVDGEELENAAALKEKLLSINKEGSTYIIRDSHAVKAVYDEAKAVLDELSYSYSEDV